MKRFDRIDFINTCDCCKYLVNAVISDTEENNYQCEECSIQKLADLVANHDWYYSFSDDARVYRKGEKEWRDINNLQLALGDKGFAAIKEFKERAGIV